ncbi:hypothetical protein [Massilia sp. DWR3-1-1]|uniref:hypothetical protein n=1 Tax=Massilia sp. DWR3-1-1 TaxID=2804559 RepID=UPI003CE8E226
MSAALDRRHIQAGSMAKMFGTVRARPRLDLLHSACDAAHCLSIEEVTNATDIDIGQSKVCARQRFLFF